MYSTFCGIWQSGLVANKVLGTLKMHTGTSPSYPTSSSRILRVWVAHLSSSKFELELDAMMDWRRFFGGHGHSIWCVMCERMRLSHHKEWRLSSLFVFFFFPFFPFCLNLVACGWVWLLPHMFFSKLTEYEHLLIFNLVKKSSCQHAVHMWRRR